MIKFIKEKGKRTKDLGFIHRGGAENAEKFILATDSHRMTQTKELSFKLPKLGHGCR